jgi:F0F1-type ATP synthase assembly protein I
MSSVGRSRPHVRGWLSPVLAALTVLALIISMLAVWVRTTVLDTDRFMSIVEPTLTDEAFPAALSDVLAEQVLVALDLDTRVTVTLAELDAFLVDSVRDALDLDLDLDPAALARLTRRDRPTLTALAPGIATALEARVVDVVDAFVRSDAFAARLPGLVRQTHRATVALIRDDLTQLPSVSVADGAVRLDLVPLVAEVLQKVADELPDLLPDVTVPEVVDDRLSEGREQLAAALQTRLPDDFGQVTIISQADLSELQSVVRIADRLVGAIVVLAMALLVATLVTARDVRRSLLQLAVGLVIGVAAATVLVRRAEAAVLGAITDPEGLRAAGVLLAEVTLALRSIAIAVALAALVTAAVAYVAGRPRWLTPEPERHGDSHGGGLTTRRPGSGGTGRHDERSQP